MSTAGEAGSATGSHPGRLELWRRAITVAWNTIQGQYNRTYLGPLWLTLGMGIFIVFKGLLFGKIFDLDRDDFLPYLSVGIILWSFFTLSVNGGCLAFVKRKALITNLNIPINFYVSLHASEATMLFLHTALVIPLLLMFFPQELTWIFLLPVGLAIVLITGWGVTGIFAVIGARYRDVTQFVQSIMRVMYFMTPVFWYREQLGHNAWFADINPFYHFIEIVRAPLLGELPATLSYIVTLSLMVLSAGLARVLLAHARSRVPFWI